MGDLTATDANPLRVLLRGGPVPRVAVSFTDLTDDDDVAAAEATGLDVAEIRIDRFTSNNVDHVVTQVRRFAERFPTLATIRSAAEGGDWSGPDPERVGLFRAVLPLVDGIDVELGSAEALAPVLQEAVAADRLLVVSHHDFRSTPSRGRLDSIVREGDDLGADLVKVAAMVCSPEDLRTLASFTLDNAERGVIVIGMGANGTATRVFFPALGSRLTFAYRSHPVPGQLAHAQTVDMLRCFYPDYRSGESDLAGT